MISTWTVVGSIVVAVISLSSAVWVSLIQRRTTLESARSVPYDVLIQRVGDLETNEARRDAEIRALRRNMRELDDDVDVVVDALHPFVDWDGLPPVPTISQAALDIVQRRRQKRAQERRS